jgi:hypothetical protein
MQLPHCNLTNGKYMKICVAIRESVMHENRAPLLESCSVGTIVLSKEFTCTAKINL